MSKNSPCHTIIVALCSPPYPSFPHHIHLLPCSHLFTFGTSFFYHMFVLQTNILFILFIYFWVGWFLTWKWWGNGLITIMLFTVYRCQGDIIVPYWILVVGVKECKSIVELETNNHVDGVPYRGPYVIFTCLGM